MYEQEPRTWYAKILVALIVAALLAWSMSTVQSGTTGGDGLTVAGKIIIGIFHPLVTKGEYYFGVRIWWIFLLMGIAAVIGSVLVENIVWSTLLAVWGASSFWSIGELFEQRKRVEKGWFPKRPEKKER